MYDKRIRIQVATLTNGVCPFELWLESILDIKLKKQVLARIDRVKLGNFGDYKSLGEGLYELRIHYAAGHRIYFGFLGKDVILLVGAGSKKLQVKDIHMAKRLFREIING